MLSPRLSALIAGSMALACTGCGADGGRATTAPTDDTSGWTTHRDPARGFSVRHPPSWHRAATPVAPKLRDPREVLSVATFALRHRTTNCEAFGGAARTEMHPKDVFVTVQERGRETGAPVPFPPRPRRFGPAGGQPAEPGCGDPPGTIVFWRDVADGDRRFHVLVALGPDASAKQREEAWRILDTLWFDPAWRPGWPASE